MTTPDIIQVLKGLVSVEHKKIRSEFDQHMAQVYGLARTIGREQFDKEQRWLDETGQDDLDGHIGLAIRPAQGLLDELLGAWKDAALRVAN